MDAAPSPTPMGTGAHGGGHMDPLTVPGGTVAGASLQTGARHPLPIETVLAGVVLHIGPHGPMVEIHQRAGAEPVLLALTQAEADRLSRRLILLAALKPGQPPEDTAQGVAP